MIRYTFMMLLIIAFIPIAKAQTKADTITNKTIIELKSAGLGNDIIKDKIQSSICNFDLTTEGLIQLKKAGISDDVMSAMMAKVNKPQSSISNTDANQINSENSKKIDPGIYYCKGNPCKLVDLEATFYSATKEGSGLLSAVTYGIAKTKMKATLSGSTANMQIHETSPQFYFYFDQNTSNGFGNNGVQDFWFNAASSPNEFMLIKFTQKKKSREVITGSISTYSGISSGIDDDNKINFRFKKLAQGEYRVYTDLPLEKGEYCFMYAGGAAESFGIAPLMKVYDFSIQ